MSSGLARIKQWIGSRDQGLLILLALTLAGFMARWALAVGFVLGDDISYVDLIRDTLNGYFMTIEPIGQYAYRPMWVYPLAASVKMFGWDRHILVLYPLVCGSLIPLLTALWVRRHLPPGSKAPILCAAILVCYPTLFVDSLVLANETPMIFWALACVNLFGVAFAHVAESTRFSSRPGRLGVWALLTGLAFCAAYQVKASAIPALGLWLAGDLVLQIRRHGWPKLVPFALAAGVFLLPVIGVQAFYFFHTGHPLGNFIGEVRLYDLWLPKEYFLGQIDNSGMLMEYVRQLFLPHGADDYQNLLHGVWAWIGLGLAVIVGLAWRKFPPEHRVLAGMLILVSVGLFLFMEFWPARTKPYYIPNCFSGRPWRYMDVLAPTIAAWIAIVLTLPGRLDRGILHALRVGLLGLGFGVAGYSLMVRCYEFVDRTSEFRRVADDPSVITPYLDVPHYLDVDGFGQLRAFLGLPERPVMNGRGSGADQITLDFRPLRGACVWTGGARHYGVNFDDAWSPERIKVIGGELRLVHTWPGALRPWRIHPLQLWAYHPAPKTIHDPPTHP